MAAEERGEGAGGARELWRLSIEERQLSALRRQLHARIDAGSAGIGAEEREQWLSAARRDLHAAIDERGGRFERR
jgi:hypothetical protein